MSVTLREGAFAKINLTLDVLGKRPDGYHDIQSVMQTISIRDDVEVEVGTAKPWTLSCDKEDVPQDSSNLAWKAAEMFCRAAKRDPEGVAIRITKRIPTQAGLGGGRPGRVWTSAARRQINHDRKHHGQESGRWHDARREGRFPRFATRRFSSTLRPVLTVAPVKWW